MSETSESTPAWRVVCVKRETVPTPRPHIHVTGIGTGELPTWADMRWTLRQVLAALDEGESFYLQDETTGQRVELEKGRCPVCRKICIRPGDEKLAEHFLREMRECVYRADPPQPFSES